MKSVEDLSRGKSAFKISDFGVELTCQRDANRFSLVQIQRPGEEGRVSPRKPGCFARSATPASNEAGTASSVSEPY